MTNGIRRFARVLGNFGVSFFTPLAAINIGRAMFEVNDGLSFYQIIIVALISALFVTGLSISREAVDYGSENARRNQ